MMIHDELNAAQGLSLLIEAEARRLAGNEAEFLELVLVAFSDLLLRHYAKQGAVAYLRATADGVERENRSNLIN